MARLIDSLFLSGVGTSGASGTVNFYQPSTLVSVPVYSDDALTQAIAQPMVLDANGKTALPVYTATPARAIIKAQSGVTLFDVARIDGDRAELVGLANASWPGSSTVDAAMTALAGSLGGTNGNFLANGTGAVPRSLQSALSEIWFSVKSFGAAGNGIADDTTPIQNAITACQAIGGGVVYFPFGTYQISSPLSITAAGLTLLGQNASGATIRNTSATGNAINVTAGGGVTTFRTLNVAHSSNSTGIGINVTSGTGLILDGITVAFHAIAVSTTVPFYASNVSASTTAASTSAALTYVPASSTPAVVYGGLLGSTLGAGISVATPGVLVMTGTTIAGAAVGVDVLAGASLYAYGVTTQSVTTGLRTAATSVTLFHQACSWGAVNDQRTGVPVSYTFAADGNFTPLPMQTEAIRVVATAAATVTINAIAKTGFGRKFSLTLARTTGSAVTFTFAAQYVLSAAVAPANGNRVNLLLEYDPIDDKVYEIGRAATAN